MSRPEHTTRRRVLAGLGATALLAGCTGESSDPTYERATADATNETNASRSAAEMSAAAAVAETDANERASSLDALEIQRHEFAVQSGYKGATVQGTATNSGQRLDYAEVRVRVYGDDGAHLGRFLATTGDLAADDSWEFEVILLASPDDIAEYDIAVLGIPA